MVGKISHKAELLWGILAIVKYNGISGFYTASKAERN